MLLTQTYNTKIVILQYNKIARSFYCCYKVSGYSGR